MRTVELEFSAPQMEIIESNAQIKLFHAGVGSGKTHIIGYDNIYLAKRFPHVRGFIAANTYSQLTKSTLVGVFKFWASVGIVRDVHYVVDKIPPPNYKIIGEKLKSYDNTISFSNGKLIFLASLDNYKAIDGIEIGHAHLDETKDTAEEAVREVILARLRQVGMWLDAQGNITDNPALGVVGYNPLSIFTSPAKTDWLSEWFDFPKYFEEINDTIFEPGNYFRKRIGDRLVVISSTYHNEHNLPAGYIQSKLIDPNSHNEHRVNMIVYGSPLAKSGNEYYTRFDRLKHVRKLLPEEMEYFNNSNLHIGFDFNVVPYITGGLYKFWFNKETQRWRIHKFAELCLEQPNNTTEDLCSTMIELYSHEMKKGLFYYGDYSGKNRNTISHEHNFNVIERKLKPYLNSTSDRVIVNLPVASRKEFMNKIFYGSLPIDFTMDPSCVKLVADCEFLQEGPDGGKLKKKVTVNGVSFEKYGHTSDETEYVITSAFNQYFNL